MGRTANGEIKVSSEKFSDSLKKILGKYGDDVTEVVRKSVKKSGNYARDKLKQVSPKDKTTSEDDSKRYAAGWRASEFSWTALGAEVIIHNATKPGLAHLLENGHLMRNGQRSPKYVHIKPVEEEVKQIFEETIVRGIKDV